MARAQLCDFKSPQVGLNPVVVSAIRSRVFFHPPLGLAGRPNNEENNDVVAQGARNLTDSKILVYTGISDKEAWQTKEFILSLTMPALIPLLTKLASPAILEAVILSGE